jgi:glycosyltransferase involved in cell wall biosynthesis
MCFSSGSGGMELDTIKLADLLCSECEIVLLCKKDSYIHAHYKADKKQYVCEPVRFGSRTFSPSMLFKVRKIIEKYKVKNVIFFGASELKTLYFSFIGFDLNVIVRHGTTKSTSKQGPVHRLVYSCVNYHVALSRHLLNNVKSVLPANEQAQLRIITLSYPYGQHIEKNRKLDKSGQLHILHVGRIAPGKGQIEAIKSCAELYRRGIDFKLDLLGGIDNARYSSQLKSIIKKTGLSDKVNMHGHVSNVSDYMADADILLFPSYGEGMSNALIESLHYGLVCICFSNTVFPEFVEMGFYLILANDRDQQDLSKKLILAVENLSDEKNKSEKNRKLALEYFNTERERDEWKKLLV